jgi:integrase
VADDENRANGAEIINFDQAQEMALEGIKVVVEDMTISEALDHWRDWKINSTDNPTRQRDVRSEASRLGSAFGTTTIKQVTPKQIDDWHQGFLEGYEVEKARRKRRATANRALNNLKAALNRACDQHGVDLEVRPWSKVKRFKKEDAFGKRIIVLTEKQEAALVDAAEDEPTRNLIRAAFLTGCRYGELIGAKIGDLKGNRLTVSGKTGKRTIVLSPDGASFFAQLAQGVNDPDRPLLIRNGDKPWIDHAQIKPIARAVQAAGLDPDTTIYAARHSYITRALSYGVPLTAIAKQCGTSALMIEQTYANFLEGQMDEWFAFPTLPQGVRH